MKISSFAFVALAATAVTVNAQEREDRTLLSQTQMTAIINEVSGDRAMNSLLEMVPYQRVRPPSEYNGNYRESQVVARFAREAGYSNVRIEEFGPGGTAWQPTKGELWMKTPKDVKLFDIHDIALALGSLNQAGDLSGELVDVGPGRAEDFEGKNVRGKFVLSTGSTNAVYALAIERGALGALGVSAIGHQRATDYPNQIVSQNVNAQPNTVAWHVTPEVRNHLAALLLRGETVTIRSIVETVEVPNRMEYVLAEIPGDGSTDQEVAIAAHLYEGVIKQGANDDNSGVALTMEIGRAYLKLIEEGKLPRPKRTINFVWVPEISGTNAFLAKYPEKQKKIIGTLNFDMEGIRIATSRSFWILQRTPDTFASYLNDIAQSMMEYVAEISRERVRFRRSINGYAPSQPVEAIHGSKDAFYIKIDKHYGSSDHVTYMQHGIPAVMFITWPDMWYHSSEDTPDKQDATQYKRAATVGLGSLAVLASGTDEMAARVLNENMGRGLARMGESHTKGLGYMADAADGPSLTTAYKEARNAINHQASVEKAVVRSASILWTDANRGRQRTAAFEPLIDRRAAALLNEVKAAYELQAAQRGVRAVDPVVTQAEREAGNLVVTVIPPPPDQPRRRVAIPGPSLPDEFNAELGLLSAKGYTALQIRDFLSGQFTPLPMEEVMAALRAREAAGLIRLTPRGSR
ncbi:MAG TPA: M28 family peptidase [Gemmatimonadales bacterium]|nr:M28 family peptidase [Gemmatimonadales bacterium]